MALLFITIDDGMVCVYICRIMYITDVFAIYK